MRPSVTVPVLSSTIVSTRRVDSRISGSLDQQAELGAATGPDHERRRGCEPERAGAGDDEDGDRGGEGERRPLARGEPVEQCRQREGDDDRDEDAGHPIGQPLDRGLAGLGVVDELGDLRERRVGADSRGADDQAPAGVDRRPGHLGPRADLDGHRLPGEQAHVDRRDAFDDDAIGRDLLSGPYDEQLPGLELFDRDPPLPAGIVEHRDVLGAELEQRAQRRAGAALGARLEVPAQQDQRGDDRGDLEVDVAHPGAALGHELEGHGHAGHAGVADEEGIDRPQPGREHPHRDQRVHRRRPVLEVGPGRLVERPGTPEDDGRRELHAEPLPVLELQRRDHGHQQHRQ